MNVACFDRFVTWFSYHLSNFQFRWSWDDWDEALAQDPEQPKAKFIREVLLKCLRLSYHQRVTDIVPETFSGFLPDKSPPFFKFSLEACLGSQPVTAWWPPSKTSETLRRCFSC